jgi:hypothetical protein
LRGWTQGTPRDNTRKIHPDLVDWERLAPPAERKKDWEPIGAIPKALAAAGKHIVKG